MQDTKQRAIELKDTETEYLLYIPPWHKERAKSISGWWWDTARKCWVYQKTPRTYDALIAEFGDDLVSVPSPPVRSQAGVSMTTTGLQNPADLKSENQSLKEDIARLQESVQMLANTSNDEKLSEIRELKRALAARESELSEIKRQLYQREKDLEDSKQAISVAQSEGAQLRAINDALQSEVEANKRKLRASNLEKYFQTRIKDIAKQTAGGNPKFVALVDKLTTPSSLIDLATELEQELRNLLDTADRSLNLYDLITQARDGALLTEQGVDMAHVIRKQRNIAAHDNATKSTLVARGLLSLFAASILWAEFSS